MITFALQFRLSQLTKGKTVRMRRDDTFSRKVSRRQDKEARAILTHYFKSIRFNEDP